MKLITICLCLINTLYANSTLEQHSNQPQNNDAYEIFTCPTAEEIIKAQRENPDIGQFTIKHHGLDFLIHNAPDIIESLNSAYGFRTVRTYDMSCEYGSSAGQNHNTLKARASIKTTESLQTYKCRMNGNNSIRGNPLGTDGYYCNNNPENCTVFCPMTKVKLP